MPEKKIMERCFMCESEYQMGPNRYEGKYIPRYAIGVCRVCYDGNWDGWSPHYGNKLITHLKKKGMAIPEQNEKGLLPRD